jgi:hypothetical protein
MMTDPTNTRSRPGRQAVAENVGNSSSALERITGNSMKYSDYVP